MLALPLDEAALDAALAAHTTRPRAVDKLAALPAFLQREGQPVRPMVVIDLAGTPLILSADAARRLAVHQDTRGREGCAHDLMAAADSAEQLAAILQAELRKALH